uniref:NTPase n=1 Tax=candidate division WOR-3 bacterium TaxID=2052148 RepID=A0A7C6A917_UNCW3
MTKILLLGRPRSGKTTLVKKVLAQLPKSAYGGFFTEELKEGGKRVGFKVVATDGEEGILAHKNYQSPNRVGQYGINISDFERVALKAIAKAFKERDLIVIDEIGKMELLSEKFQKTVLALFKEEKKILATIPISDIPLIRRLKNLPDVLVIEVTESASGGNRERLITEILERINYYSSDLKHDKN